MVENENKTPGKKRKLFFEDWWNDDLKFTLLFSIIGIIVGIISFAINRTIPNLILMVAIFLGSAMIVNKMSKIEEGKGWWFGKFVVYLFIWFVVWTIFHTTCRIYNTFCF